MASLIESVARLPHSICAWKSILSNFYESLSDFIICTVLVLHLVRVLNRSGLFCTCLNRCFTYNAWKFLSTTENFFLSFGRLCARFQFGLTFCFLPLDGRSSISISIYYQTILDIHSSDKRAMKRQWRQLQRSWLTIRLPQSVGKFWLRTFTLCSHQPTTYSIINCVSKVTNPDDVFVPDKDAERLRGDFFSSFLESQS